ncbi:anti-phage ATPase IteA [Cupriavidus necator]|uniref:anti-phage ATPase IteA n=1 Tax=Cupriavidus necator TaxID=106590 RepID=UPI00277F0628|nr:anti-phage ATPase IteA [Cupriavidus necator]MDQ0138956.1 ATP-dependent Zn protease [Cupriavidus necator]
MSEVLKILDGALKANASMAGNYAGLLADKLERSGEREDALRIRDRLARAPSAMAFAQDGSRMTTAVPTDTESRLDTVDISYPALQAEGFHLPSAAAKRLQEFVATVANYDRLAAAGIASVSRLLLYGPPGTGKTMTARQLASELALPLATVRCDTLISSLLGQTSRNLRRVFDFAEQTPSVLLLDEFDALASARGNERDVGELQRIVIALLQNIDALPGHTVVVAATNFAQGIDPAVWRRFPFQIPFSMPDASLRRALWKTMLRNFAPASLHWDELVHSSEGVSGAIIEQVCNDAIRTAILAGQPEADPTEILRRLGIAISLMNGHHLPSIEDEVRWLRQWRSEAFSLRELARLYEVSTRQISNMLRGQNAAKGTGKKNRSG